MPHQFRTPKLGGSAVLLIHGLGESGQCFKEAFGDHRLDDYGLLVPDLLGYGSASRDPGAEYSLDAHVQRLIGLLDDLELERVAVVGHSMGGDIGTLLCAALQPGRVELFLNIEGNVTSNDLFLSSRGAMAGEVGGFHRWLREVLPCQLLNPESGGVRRSIRRYCAALELADEEAFLANSVELVRRNTQPVCGGSEIGLKYFALPMRKVYCFGSKNGVSPATVAWLKAHAAATRRFPRAGHWVMIDSALEFYGFLAMMLGQSATPIIEP